MSANVEVLESALLGIRAKIASYAPQHVLNAEKFGIFYRQPPGWSLSSRPCTGHKKEKREYLFWNVATLMGKKTFHLWLSDVQRGRGHFVESMDTSVASNITSTRNIAWPRIYFPRGSTDLMITLSSVLIERFCCLSTTDSLMGIPLYFLNLLTSKACSFFLTLQVRFIRSMQGISRMWRVNKGAGCYSECLITLKLEVGQFITLIFWLLFGGWQENGMHYRPLPFKIVSVIALVSSMIVSLHSCMILVFFGIKS